MQLTAPMSPLLPGGYGRSALVVGTESPHLVSGQGYQVIDETGRRLVDLNNNFTGLVHGNAHPDLVEAAQQAIAEGSCFGMPSRFEHEHASLLVDRIPGAEQVRYANSGSEAVTTAVRIARAATGRDRVLAVRGAYHGTGESAIGTGGPKSTRGIPGAMVAQLALVDLNDIEALEATIEEEPNAFAAVLLDMLPNRAGLLPLSDEFVRTARQLCDRHGIIFIDDEVIALRLAPQGRAASKGVVADLTVVGKLVGGGLPVGAVAGPRALMDELNPLRPDGLEHGGTFTANPVVLRAGAEALRLYDERAIERLNALGATARAELSDRLAPTNWEVRGEGSLLRVFPPNAEDAPSQQRRVWWAAYERGVALMPHAMMALSTPMTSEVVLDAVERVASAVESVAADADGRVTAK